MSCSDIPDRPIAEQIEALERAQAWDRRLAIWHEDQIVELNRRMARRGQRIAELQEKVKP